MRPTTDAVLTTAPHRRGCPPRLLLTSCAVALAMIALAAQPARAGFNVSAKSAKGSHGLNSVKFQFGSDALSGPIWAGAFKTTISSSSVPGLDDDYTTFCVDLAEFVANDPLAAEVSLTNNPNLPDSANPTRPRNIGAAGWILNTYGSGSALAGSVDINTNLTALLTSLSITATKNEVAAALQLAIWEAAYDTDGGMAGTHGFLTGGSLKFELASGITSNVVTLTNAMLNARLAASGSSAIGLINYPPNESTADEPHAQDQIFVVPGNVNLSTVPEPSTLAMAATGGLLGLGTLLRRRFKGATPRS